MCRTVFSKGKWLIAVIFAWLLAACKQQERLPYYNTPDFTPLFLSSPDLAKDSVTHRIAPFSFINQNGDTITEKSVSGKIHIANFIFISCGSICPVMTRNLLKADQHFAADSNVVFLSFSVTPWIDSVPKLQAYKRQYHIQKSEWHFLTGDRAAIYTLARQSYFAEEKLGFTKDSTSFLHTEHILLVDKSGRIRGIYNGTLKPDITQLIADIETLKKE